MVDGHCATDAETVYVGTLGSAICSETNDGSAQKPVCSLLAGVGLSKTSSGTKPVVVIEGTLTTSSTTISVSFPLTIVGKNNATLTPTTVGSDCITITSGEVRLRSLTIQGSASPATGMGINATPGTGSTVTLYMDGCKVMNNPGGGILLNGAAFDIENTTVGGNGHGTVGSTTWGGIFVQRLPTDGPTTLNLVAIQNNQAPGLSCSGAIQGTGVLATGNLVEQITASCGVTSCSPDAGTACGAP